MKCLILIVIFTFTACITNGPEDLHKPVRVVNVIEQPRRCRATLMGSDGELWDAGGEAQCAWQAGQVLEAQEKP